LWYADIVYEVGMIDELLRGLLGTSMETLDQFITHEVTNHLFEEKSKPFSGLDLAALNIQRGKEIVLKVVCYPVP
jgi:peroxidase